MPFISTIGGGSAQGFGRGGGSPLAEPTEYEFWLWGAGGGAGSQNRNSANYHTTTYTKIKEGGAGGVVYVRMQFVSGTNLLLTVGGKGIGAGVNGNGTNSTGGYNGGGRGSIAGNDGSGSGGGYTGIFIGNGDSDKTQAKAVAISPGGGGGGGGPGYYNHGYSNGGGGITASASDGRGQQGDSSVVLGNAGETDEVVTIDLKRVIRWPTSLHGKSGMKVVELPLERLDPHGSNPFDPLTEAVPWNMGSQDVKVRAIKSDVIYRIGSNEGQLSEGETYNVDEATATFLVLKKWAEPVE